VPCSNIRNSFTIPRCPFCADNSSRGLVIYFLETKRRACMRGMKDCPGERKVFAAQHHSSMRSPLSCSPRSPILSVHHHAVFKSQRVESRSDRDKGNKRREYVRCNKARNWATWMSVETGAGVASQEQLGSICRSDAMKGKRGRTS
jgi:hypothetical protein